MINYTRAPELTCRSCKKKGAAEYRVVEDDYGHEDEKYHCRACNFFWWVEGADY